MEIKYTKKMGLGIFMKESIKKNDNLFKYRHDKMIGSEKFQFNLFFKNTLIL